MLLSYEVFFFLCTAFKPSICLIVIGFTCLGSDTGNSLREESKIVKVLSVGILGTSV